jgi:hypothetical protein
MYMQPRSYVIRVIFSFLPLAAVSLAAIGFCYVVAQQAYRQNANDPQVALATEAARVLSGGAEMESILPSGAPVAIESSLSPYVIIYDRTGTPVSGSGSLHGGAPVLPLGVLSAAQEKGQNRLTWQPEEGIRQAIVVVPYQSATSGGYVMAGRSLTEAESREADLTLMALVALAAALGVSLVAVLVREWLR